MKKITTKKLLNYSAMSAAILGTANAAGQVTFTDVDPDEVIELGGLFNIDFNDDGTDDISISVFDADQGAGAVVFATGNGSNGNLGSNGNGFVGFSSGNYGYPLSLEEGAIINDTQLIDVRGDLNFYSCGYSGSQFCDGQDGFLGISFELNGNTHFGWVGLNVDPSGSPITVFDYAFNATPDEPIAAGDIGLSVNDQAFENFNYTVANGMLTMSAKTAMENVTIFNISGQQVINKGLSSTNENVEISNLSTGVYIATVTVEGRAKSFKFVK